MVDHLDRHSLFERILGEELVTEYSNLFPLAIANFKNWFDFFVQESDPVVEKLYETSEEGQKVTRNKGDKFVAVYRRIKS